MKILYVVFFFLFFFGGERDDFRSEGLFVDIWNGTTYKWKEHVKTIQNELGKEHHGPHEGIMQKNILDMHPYSYI